MFYRSRRSEGTVPECRCDEVHHVLSQSVCAANITRVERVFAKVVIATSAHVRRVRRQLKLTENVLLRSPRYDRDLRRARSSITGTHT